MKFSAGDEYHADPPRINIGDDTWDLEYGPIILHLSLTDLKALRYEVEAALMEYERAELGYRGMLDDEKQASEDYSDAPF